METVRSSTPFGKTVTKPTSPIPRSRSRRTHRARQKIRGKVHYFRKWARRESGKLVRVDGDGWKEALEEYKVVADDLHTGRTPRAKNNGLVVKGLCNAFLTAKLRKVEAGELTKRLFLEYRETTDLIVKQFGGTRLVEDLAAEGFAALRATMTKRWGPRRLASEITRTKGVFKYGYESGLMDRPVRYGPEFVKPGRATMRRHRAQSEPKMFAATDLRELIDGATKDRHGRSVEVKPGPVLRAMILLGANCGFGNTDCSSLTLKALDLAGGWINFPRPKTGIARRCPLWPETVDAIRAASAVRPQSVKKEDAGRLFLSGLGNPLVTFADTGARKDLISVQFAKLLNALGIRRKGVGFYALRRVFETVAGGSKDQVAVDVIMGHSDPSMVAVYREGIEDARLRAVTDHVRKWLFGGT